MSNVNRGSEVQAAVTEEQMQAQLDQVLNRIDEKNETLEEAVEAVAGRLDADLVAYAQGKKIPTVHNPTNFEPKDYEVEDYLDNKRPLCYAATPGEMDDYRREVEAWEADMLRTLGPDWRAKSHRCIHCGNGTVRWITATRHLPTNEVVVFGAVCTKRLGFKDAHSFKLAQLQAYAEARKVKFTIFNDRAKFIAEHPEVAEMLLHVDEPQHAKNFFLKDVLAKLDQYGTLSTNQLTAIVSSYARDNDYAAKKAAEATEVKGDAPNGRVTVTGVVLSLKSVEGYMHGTSTLKMLLKLENNSKVWLTCNKFGIERGDTITVKATFEVSRDDKSFAFGKRPIVESIVKGTK